MVFVKQMRKLMKGFLLPELLYGISEKVLGNSIHFYTADRFARQTGLATVIIQTKYLGGKQ